MQRDERGGLLLVGWDTGSTPCWPACEAARPGPASWAAANRLSAHLLPARRIPYSAPTPTYPPGSWPFPSPNNTQPGPWYPSPPPSYNHTYPGPWYPGPPPSYNNTYPGPGYPSPSPTHPTPFPPVWEVRSSWLGHGCWH